MKAAVLLTTLLAASLAAASPPPALRNGSTAGETPEQFAQRTQWWREAKFGMFIHWGVYAVPADATTRDGQRSIAEWYFSNKQVQVRDYERFAGQFNPVRFDAKRWVKTAKDAGMKYIVITSKHHDGFCMFDSQLTGYSITRATPFKRDPMKELAQECRRQGIRLGFYHSIMDWHHPDYLPRRSWEGENRPAGGASLDRYVEHMKGQLRELLTNYGPVGVIWFDGGWEHNAQELHSAEVNAMIRSLQPNVIINDRNHLLEDHATPEQTIPARADASGRLWETCMTINDTWGYAKNDTNWKPADELIHKLCDIAGKGGNFLLNVGPTAEGEFPVAINDRLAAIGRWMKVNGPALYGTTRGPFNRLPFDGRCTQKGSTLYLLVFRWPQEGLTLTGLQTPVQEARALDGGERLPVETGTSSDASLLKTVRIGKPARLDPAATVIELRLAGAPVVAQVSRAMQAGLDGVLTLKAEDAEIHGQTVQYEQGNGHDNIGFWTNAQDYVTWRYRADASGPFRVEVSYACPPESEGSTFTIGVEGGATIEATVKATNSWTDFRQEALGNLLVPKGERTVSVRIVSMPHGAAMNLKSVRLVPVR